MRDAQSEFSHEELIAIEWAAIHAWPALKNRDIDGWLWRYSGGGSQRANSVSPIAFHGTDVEEAIDEAERLYFSQSAASRFRVFDTLSQPADLDQRLEARGYKITESVLTLAKRVGACSSPLDVRFLDQPSDGWMEVYLSNIAADRRPAAPSLLALVPQPRTYFTVEVDGQVISTGLGVRCGNVVIAECIGTRQEARRTGGASRVMTALEAWAKVQGASIVALQAVTTNFPAQQLYAALGYTKIGGLHYRVRER